MRRLPHVGCYWAERRIDLAASVGNLLVISADALLWGLPHVGVPSPIPAILAQPHLRVIVQWGPYDEAVARQDYTGYTHLLELFRRELDAAGILPRVVGWIIGEEWYLRAIAGGYDYLPGAAGMDPYLRADYLCRAMSDAAACVHAVFPGVSVGQVEGAWNQERDYGWQDYAPVPAGLDFLGVDAYVTGSLSRRAFDAQVEPVYTRAARYGRPLLAVGQAFSDAMRHMPSVSQLQWWADLADRHPVVGLLWFCLEQPSAYDPRHGQPGQSTGLIDHPGPLGAAQWFAAWCQAR